MPPQQSPPPQLFILFILLFYILNSPDQGAPLGFASPQEYAEQKLVRYRHGVDIVNSTKWQEFAPKSAKGSPGESTRYLNLTGFRKEDDYAWERLDAFKSRSEHFGAEAKKQWRFGKDGKVGLQGMVYENVTGIVQGKWVRYTDDIQGEQRKRYLNLTEISPGIDWAFFSPELWTRNITGAEGDMMLRIDGNKAFKEEAPSRGLGLIDHTRPVKGRLSIKDETSSGDGWDISLHGVHWSRQGVMFMTTTSDKFAGIFGLPHLTTDTEYYETSQTLLNGTLEKAVHKMEETLWRDLNNPWSATPDDQADATMPTPHCEFVVFVQVQPIRVDHSHDEYFQSVNIVEEIERELRFPTGAPIPEIPRLEMSTVIFSPDCGFILESKGPPSYSPKEAQHLIGKKEEHWLRGVHKWLNGFAVIIFLQILLLKIQSKEASTPSTVGRVSLFTIAFLLMADGLVFSSMSFLSVLAPFLFPSAFIVSFMGLISVGMGVRFCAAVYNVQEPERRARLREQQAAREAAAAATSTASPAVIITPAGADSAPPPPIIIPSDQDVDAEISEAVSAAAPSPLPITNRPVTIQPEQASQTFGAAYAKFVLTLTGILFLSLTAHSWSRPWRNGYTNLLAFVYLSFWWPQIHRNVVRNCRKALLWKFIIGQSFLRLLPIAYFYLKKDNIIWGETDWKSFAVLAGWVWLQIWILIAQEVLGPRWGLPKRWYTEGWDYHPVLREDNVEAGGLPIGLVQAPSSPTLDRVRTGDEEFAVRKKKDSSMRVVDCAICMHVLEVPVIASGVEASSASAAGGVTGMLARRQYMVTPCRHVFHSLCLEGWMKFRLQCPICRETLPPL